MCSLCGGLGSGEHWTGAIARPDVFTRNVGPIERRRARADQVRVANRILTLFGMTVSDWQGTAFLLSTRTGATTIIADLGHLWPAAERLGGQLCDPLEPRLLERLERPRD